MSQEKPPSERGTNDRVMSNLWGLLESTNEELENTRDKEKRASLLWRVGVLTAIITAFII